MATRRKKSKIDKRFLITQLRRLDYGNQNIHRVLAPVSFILALFTLLKVYNIEFGIQQIGFLALAAVAAMFALGYVWDRKGFVEEEIEYGLERNRFVRAVLGTKRSTWLKKLQGARIR